MRLFWSLVNFYYAPNITNINKITSSGNCSLTISQTDRKTLQQTSGIYPMPNSSTCKGFTIPINQLQSGDASVKLIVEIEGQTATAAENYTIK